VKSREFIVDRLHGKPVQRRADVTESETVAAARRDYEVSRRYVLALNEMLGEICCETCAAKIGQVFAESDLIQSILATTDERYREVVERELESVAGESSSFAGAHRGQYWALSVCCLSVASHR
jgi:hypothetical protein